MVCLIDQTLRVASSCLAAEVPERSPGQHEPHRQRGDEVEIEPQHHEVERAMHAAVQCAKEHEDPGGGDVRGVHRRRGEEIEGKRVALGEVEGCLESFPKIKAAQARLVSDPFNGSMVVAKVVASAKCHAEEIIDHCARNLAPYKVPRRIEFCEAI